MHKSRKTILTLYKILAFVLLIFIGSLATTIPTSAQEMHNDYQGTWRAKVTEVFSERTEDILGAEMLVQNIEIEFLNGPSQGERVIFDSDFPRLDIGDKVYVNHLMDIDGAEHFGVINIDRKGSLLTLVLFFIFAVIIFGRWQGVRALVALVGSFFAIMLVLVPGILNGWNPLLASFLVASGILFVAIFFTHGFNRESAVAYGGTMIAVILAGIFAVVAVDMTDLSGFASEESVYLNFNTGGTINFTALLLGAFIIGFLGVLDDIAVTQSAVVNELLGANPDASKKEVYNRAMRIGREHVGALVNTLVLAYTGASLPLLLYFYLGSTDFLTTINLELFATEIVRIVVGSVGLILTVPIVTGLAVFYLKGTKQTSHHHHHHH